MSAEFNESFLYPLFRRAALLYRRINQSSSPLRALALCSAAACPLARPALSDDALHALDARAAEQIEAGGGALLPEPAWGGGGDERLFGRLPQVLQGRTLLFVGDSVMRQTAVDLLLAVRFYREATRRAPAPAHVTLAANVHCYVWVAEACRVCFLRAARQASAARGHTAGHGGTLRVPRDAIGRVNSTYCAHVELAAHDLGDALACAATFLALDARDVLVVNAGVHHNEPHASLRANVRSFLRWRDAAAAARAAPCVLWRETFPTHFASPDGTFPAEPRLRRALDLRCNTTANHCAPFSRQLMDEVRRGATRQKFNDAANPLLKAAGVPILRVFLAAAALYDVHVECLGPEGHELDCVHHAFPSAAYQLAIRLMLLALEEQCGISFTAAESRKGRQNGSEPLGDRHDMCWPVGSRCDRSGPLNVFG
ncbi:hypothetical protein AB1Y20_022266 [Prymnesium parvum]|uniref:Uncharacterized protein n=1 Tax=Prymnesium parvum TaxID=97485 RepID=A0AB34JHW6_PRYPA